MTFDQKLADLKKKIYRPVYFLQGEEPYYIDVLSDYIEKNILSESEKEFNQTILYGKEIDLITLISFARRYPMMSSHQVIIVKEAQEMKSLFKAQKDDKDPFGDYLKNPTTSTILVFCYKYGKIDKRTKAAKTLDKTSIVYESKKLYENEIPAWVSKYAADKGWKINPKAALMFAENIGDDLSRIANEMTKLSVNLQPNEEISESMVAENIGVSKEYNIFEFQKAIASRNILRANQIAEYFSSNQKNNPMVLTITQLYSYFMKVLTYHSLEDRSKNTAASELGINPYFLNDYIKAAKEYPAPVCIRNISFLHQYDLRSKGVNDTGTGDGALLKELLYKILH